MKKIIITLFIVALTWSVNLIAQPKWVFDGAHSNLNFSIVRLTISDVTGSFQIKDASLTVKSEDFEDATAHLVVDIATIDTDVPDRDTHLQQPDMLDAKKFPEAVFHSTSFKKTGDKSYTAMGDLTFHGITKPVTLSVIANTGYDEYSSKTVTGLKVTGIIKRSDFEIAPTTPGKVLSDEVTITANLVFVKN